MKFGAVLDQQSVPNWSPHNIDYNEIKQRIKERTTKSNGPVDIPGASNPDGYEELEDELYELLRCEHIRTGRFVKCNLGECERRLKHRRDVLERVPEVKSKSSRRILKQLKRLTATEAAVVQVGDELANLTRFIEVNRLAILKLLKKYRKWTKSTGLETRVRKDFFEKPDCFSRKSVKEAQREQITLLAEVRVAISKIPECSSTEQSTTDSIIGTNPSDPPGSGNPLRSSRKQKAVETNGRPTGSRYWNEYENGSDAEDEPYTITVYPDAPTRFPGRMTLARIGRVISLPFKSPTYFKPQERVRVPPDEETALIPEAARSSSPSDDGGPQPPSPPHIIIQAPTFPRKARPDKLRYYSNFPRYSYYPPSKEELYRNYVLFWASAASFTLSLLVLALVFVLAGAGRKKLATRVHIASLVGVAIDLVLAVSGLFCHLARRSGAFWSERFSVFIVFTALCTGSGLLIAGLVQNS